MPKNTRTIKKSAAKSSVSRSVLRSAVKKSSGSAKKKAWGWAAKKTQAAKKAGARKSSPGAKPSSSTVDWVHQPSVIREPGPKVWRPLGALIGPKSR